MITVADLPATSPFWFWECFLMPMPTGKKATNLRELLHYLREMSEPVLRYHLWQSRLAITPPTLEYPNDFALWAANALHDDRLAEKLSSIDPFEFESLTEVREVLVELLEEYLWDFPHNPQVPPRIRVSFLRGLHDRDALGNRSPDSQGVLCGPPDSGIGLGVFSFH